MKKIFLLLVLCLICVACFVNYSFRRVFDNNHNISVKVRETDDTYRLYASYGRSKTHSVQRYIDQQLHTNHMFTNARMDATVTLDDNMRFYIKASPGNLYIKLNKDENDFAAYQKMKELGEGIKRNLTND